MKREVGLDLIRCVGLLFVNGVHAYLKNGFYGEPQIGAAVWVADCFRWLFFSCNGIFLLLTGYLKSGKKFDKYYFRSLLPILIGYGLTCMVTYPIRHFCLGEVLTVREWISNLFSFSNYAWYLEMYIGLILISPIINLGLDQLKDDRSLWSVAGIMLLLTAVPTLTKFPIVPDYWVNMYPLTFYVIGAVIRKCKPAIRPWLGLCTLSVIVMGLAVASILSTDDAFSKGFTQSNGGFWNTLVAVLLFLTLYRMSLPKKLERTVAWLSQGCLEGYLLSLVLDRSLYALFPQWHCPEKYAFLFFFVTIPIFAVSIIAGHGVHWLSGKLAGSIFFLFDHHNKKLTSS